MIRARVEPRLKKEAEEVLAELGLRPSEAVSVYYRQIVLRRGIPFDVVVPAPRASDDAPWRLTEVLDRIDEADQWREFASRLYTAELHD